MFIQDNLQKDNNFQELFKRKNDETALQLTFSGRDGGLL